MNIDIDKIIPLIFSYKKEPNLPDMKMFQQNIYYYVKLWPKRLYNCNEDICHDFVLYIIQYTDQILQSYNLNINVSFLTWFNAVLYNKFCDFSKQGEVASHNLIFIGDENNHESSLVSVDEIIKISSVDKVTEIVLQYLTDVDRALWLFFYSPQQITEDILLTIVQHTKKDLQEILLCYQEILKQYYECYHQREAYYLKIKNLDKKIVHIDNIILKGTTDINQELLHQKNIRYKNRQKKYLRTLSKYSLVSMRYFIKIFKNYDTAYRTLKQINHKIKKIIIEQNLLQDNEC